jgi:hypothetical protein
MGQQRPEPSVIFDFSRHNIYPEQHGLIFANQKSHKPYDLFDGCAE